MARALTAPTISPSDIVYGANQVTVTFARSDMSAQSYRVSAYAMDNPGVAVATIDVPADVTITAVLSYPFVYGEGYYIGATALADANNPLYTDSVETKISTTCDYESTQPPTSDPFTESTFKIRDRDYDGNELLYVGDTWVTFIIDHVGADAQLTNIRIKKKTDNEWTPIDGIPNGQSRTGTSGDYDWESGACELGDYYEGWGWLTFDSLEETTTYEVEAYAIKDSDCLPTITAVQIEFTTLDGLDIPSNLTASECAPTSITLTWGAVTNASGYEAICSLNDATVATLTPTDATCQFTGLTSATTYSFKVRTLGDHESYADSDYCAPIEAATTTQLAKPSINGFPRASGTTKYTTLQIRLSKTIANATSYEYQIALDENFTSGVKTRTSSTVTNGYPLSGYFTGLTSGTLYYCRARAISNDAAYSPSEWANVTNTVVASKLPAPTGLEVTDIGATSATLNWDDVENATGGYTVRWRQIGASDWNSQNV